MSHPLKTLLRKKKYALVLSIVLFLLLGSWLVYKNIAPKNASSTLDDSIRQYALSQSVSAVKNFTITEKKTFTDSTGTNWVKFSGTPVPESVTDPAYGIMKQVNGKWVGLGLGTCCVEQQLSKEVGEGLGFDMSFLDQQKGQ